MSTSNFGKFRQYEMYNLAKKKYEPAVCKTINLKLDIKGDAYLPPDNKKTFPNGEQHCVSDYRCHTYFCIRYSR